MHFHTDIASTIVAAQQLPVHFHSGALLDSNILLLRHLLCQLHSIGRPSISDQEEDAVLCEQRRTAVHPRLSRPNTETVFVPPLYVADTAPPDVLCLWNIDGYADNGATTGAGHRLQNLRALAANGTQTARKRQRAVANRVKTS